MNKILKCAFFVLSIVLISLPAKASLIGDAVDFTHYFPDLSTTYEAGSTVVASGSSDAWSNLTHNYTVDIEASSLSVQFHGVAQWIPSVFNGVVISDLDWIGDHSAILYAVTVDTNLQGWDSTRIIFGSDYAGFNWQDLYFNENTTYFIADFKFSDAESAIPEPSTLLLVLSGLFGLPIVKRRKNRP